MKPVTADLSERTIAAARAAHELAERTEPRAGKVQYSRARDAFVITLRNGVVLHIPRRLLQGVSDATPAQAARFIILGKGFGLHWPDLDADLTIPGLAAGIFGTKAWMSELGRAGGRKKSPARAAASRVNGKQGGRPRKQQLPA